MTKKKNDENSFVFYRSFYDVVNLIPDAAMRCRAYTAICEYAFHGVEPAEEEDVLVRMVFTQAKPQIDANNKRRENGKLGGTPRKCKAEPMVNHMETGVEPTVNQTVTKAEPNVNANENANVNVNEKENVNEKVTAIKFTPPTVVDVQAYITEQNLSVDANRFVDYYTANGWMVGKNTMKNWKAALRHWNRQDDRNKAHGKGGNTNGNNAERIKPQIGLCL